MNLSGLNAFDRIKLGLDHPHQKVGDIVGRQYIAVEAHVHGIDRLAGLNIQNWRLRRSRQLVLDRIHLGVDFRHGLVAVVVQTERGGNHRYAIDALRRHIVDALRLRDGGLERLRDEAGNGCSISTEVGGRIW